MKLRLSAARRLSAGALALGVLAGVTTAWRDLTVHAAESRPTAAMPRVTPVREADAACERCHAAIFQRYVTTPMANGSGTAEEHFVPGETHHTASGMEYVIDLEAGAPTLHYRRTGVRAASAGVTGTTAGTMAASTGTASAASADPAGVHRLRYFLGSGNLGSTYLYTENGYLLESPVAFYARLKGYDMAPGLADVQTMPPALPMTRGCMRCHMSDVQAPDRGSRDHFTGLPFLHGGITCEGCHGDAGAHVASGGKAAVVNPMKLDAAARDSVCISCHLEGDVSVEHKGRSVTSYKPGDHIADTLTHFVLAHDSTSRSVSETEELEASRCKRASGDRMSCMSCHDPHGDPAPEQRISFYRAKCLACHSDATFAASHFPDQPDCTGCHMPKSGATDTPHVAWTDHRIRQHPEATASSGAALQLSGLDAPAPATSSIGDKLAAPALEPVFAGTPVAPRDHALATYKVLEKGHREFAAEAWRELNEAYAADHDDAAVAMALGFLNQQQGRSDVAQRLFADAVRLDPDSSEAANDLATLLAREGKLAEARALWEKTFALNEDMETLGVNLATTDCAMGDREHAIGTLRRVLVYSPGFAPARERLQRLERGEQSCAAP